MNVVMTESGRFIEVQGTAEGDGLQPGRARRPARAGRAGHRPHRRRCRASCWPTSPIRDPAPTARADVAQLRLVVASANPDKVAEIGAILGDAFELVPRPSDVPDVVEDATSLEGNARLKAVAITRATGMASVADDTGLEVARARWRSGRALGPLRRRARDLRGERGQAAARAEPHRCPRSVVAAGAVPDGGPDARSRRRRGDRRGGRERIDRTRAPRHVRLRLRPGVHPRPTPTARPAPAPSPSSPPRRSTPSATAAAPSAPSPPSSPDPAALRNLCSDRHLMWISARICARGGPSSGLRRPRRARGAARSTT